MRYPCAYPGQNVRLSFCGLVSCDDRNRTHVGDWKFEITQTLFRDDVKLSKEFPNHFKVGESSTITFVLRLSVSSKIVNQRITKFYS